MPYSSSGSSSSSSIDSNIAKTSATWSSEYLLPIWSVGKLFKTSVNKCVGCESPILLYIHPFVNSIISGCAKVVSYRLLPKHYDQFAVMAFEETERAGGFFFFIHQCFSSEKPLKCFFVKFKNNLCYLSLPQDEMLMLSRLRLC